MPEVDRHERVEGAADGLGGSGTMQEGGGGLAADEVTGCRHLLGDSFCGRRAHRYKILYVPSSSPVFIAAAGEVLAAAPYDTQARKAEEKSL